MAEGGEVVQVTFDLEEPGQGERQFAFGLKLVDEGLAGPERLSEIGVTGYQDFYHKLLEAGWHWRKAAFMAWRAAPRGSRWPETQQELAAALGLASDRAFRIWLKKNQQMEQVIRQAALMVFESHLADVDLVTIQQARQPNSGVPERALYYKRYQDLLARIDETRPQEQDDGSDLSDLSDEELAAEAGRLAQILQAYDAAPGGSAASPAEAAGPDE